MNTPSPSRTSSWVGALTAVGLIGSLAYSIWAMFSPYAEPAASFIEWQARWGDGRYGMKATFLATWLHLLLAGGVVFAAAWAPYYLVTSLSSARTPMPSGPQWQALSTKGLRNSVLGLLLGFFPAVALYSVLLTDAESLSFVGGGSTIVFMLGPILAGVGIVSALNLVLPRRVVVGVVEALRENRDQQGRVVDHVAVIAGKWWTIPLETWRQLQVGMTVALQAPAVTQSAFALRVQTQAHYR